MFASFILPILIAFELSIEIIEFNSGNVKKLAIIYVFAAIIVRIVIAFVIDVKIPTWVSPLSNLTLLIILILRWKFTKLSMNEKSLCVFVNSLLITTCSFLLELVFIARRFFGQDNMTVEPIYVAFYLPYLWIISMYICYSRFIRNWCQSSFGFKDSSEIGKVKDCSVYVVESDV